MRAKSFFKTCFMCIVFFSFFSVAGYAADPVPAEERAALIALYNSTDGDNWHNNSGWKTSPLHTDGFAMPGTEDSWYGIGVSNGSVQYIGLKGNNLNGPIPPEFGYLTELLFLYLSDNRLNGPLPPKFEFRYCEIMDLSNNELTGSIPDSLGFVQQDLMLDNNRFTGSIPASLRNVFRGVDLSNNQLSGSIPPVLANHQEYMNLSNNRLTGSIPPEMGNLFGDLLLAGNELTGGIPTELGYIGGNLDLSGNRLTGGIPPELRYLNRRLDLSHNRLTGCIPAELRSSLLTYVGVRYNCLHADAPDLRAWLDGFDPDWENYQSECDVPPTITMLSPAGDILIDPEGFTQTVNISWDGTDPDSDAVVRLGYDVDTDYSNGYTVIDAMDHGEDGSLSWAPSPNWGFFGFPAGTYYILGIIADEENTSYAYAPGRLIVPPFELTLIGPHGGEIYTTGSIQEIKWTGFDHLNATIKYSIDNGVTWTTITSLPGPVASYNWTVPNTPSLQCKVMLADDAGYVWDVSDSTFSIVPPVHTLSVRSTPKKGVPVTLSPEDRNGLSGGDTNFIRSYYAGTTVTLTAPKTHNGKTFLKWMVDNSPRRGRTVTVTMARDHSARAIYRSQSSNRTHP